MLNLVVPAVCLCGLGDARADLRADFLAAERAVARGDAAVLESLPAALRDYPLFPYLEYQVLVRDLDAAADEHVEDFLMRYAGSPMAERLRPAYLKRLAAAERWSDYARVYRTDDSVERQCFYRRALIETGRGELALADVESLWLSGRSRPSACDPVFDAWRVSGGLTTQLVWERLRLAMEADSLGLARYLEGFLPDAEKPWFALWMAVRRDPERILETAFPSGPHQMRAHILAEGILRLAGRSATQAELALRRYADEIASAEQASGRAHSAVAKALLASGNHAGLAVWDGLVPSADNLADQERRLRKAIALGAWDWVAAWIRVMPDSTAKRDRWLYWLGRAEERLGHTEEAERSYAEAALQRSFWGFMAADRVGHAYALDHTPTPAEPERIREIVTTPAFARMRELDRLGRETDLRREWRALSKDLDRGGLLAAAYVADAFRWHDQAVFTLARADYWDDLELRFPLEHQALAAEIAWQAGLGTDWVMAVLRQESVFARTIASSAGAIGLMQLMPETAADVAAGLGLSRPSRWDLFDPQLSIRLGAEYLVWMRDRFGHAALATAAYNAGPHRVARWRPQHCTDVDLWIASIPFAETRQYVERVLTYRMIYAARLGADSFRLSEILPGVLGRDALGGQSSTSVAGGD
ncbi:transglycosylase SLT domain-containing protein [Thiorhodococcus mannitoliphagus]|uniref:Transglycosylase SLT domain-containing protein n=1 Tax=Thiorhodococcus mannitoliphagus TaxID=329406 RepID=A0A6P1DS05_9GAMM|nr:transglycosylase SLT domain-containing protein [Thiorhodococcus mannitoliphagus]NEX20629.1 transglycosylase SLT domain-containing protein [Thiorhodococcus mannitoliphagus]